MTKPKKEKLSSEQKSEIGKKAATSRWSKDSSKSGQSLGNTTKYYKVDRKIKEHSRGQRAEYYKRRKEKLKGKGKSVDPFFIKRENPKIWEAAYRMAFEKTYGKIEN